MNRGVLNTVQTAGVTGSYADGGVVTLRVFCGIAVICRYYRLFVSGAEWRVIHAMCEFRGATAV